MKIRPISSISLCFLLLSCGKLPTAVSVIKESSPEMRFVVPLTTALNSLEQYLISTEGAQTKSFERSIQSITTIDFSKFSAQNSSSSLKNVFYLVNFSDNQGYALLAADTRISTDIIAVTDNGHLTESEVYNAFVGTQEELANTRSQIDTSFIDFNEFEPFNEIYEDYYVGDYIDENDSTETGMEILPLKLCIGFAINDLRSHINDEFDPEPPPTDTLVVVIRDTVRNDAYTPMMDTCTLKIWRQSDPYNSFCPYVRWNVLSGPWVKAPVGCVPLSIARIMAYNRYPSAIISDGLQYNWESIRNCSDTLHLASFLRYVGQRCGTMYFRKGSFTLPILAASCLNNHLYQDVLYSDYNDSTVLSMLRDRKPVFVCSLPKTSVLGYDFSSCHAWIIDGYTRRVITTTTNYYCNNILVGQNISTSERTMVHCDWGWGTSHNGYYYSGVFKLNGDDIIYDKKDPPLQGYDVNHSWGTTDYNYYIKTISYSLL